MPVGVSHSSQTGQSHVELGQASDVSGISWCVGNQREKYDPAQMGPVRIRHSSRDFATQASHSMDLAGWQAKMASIEISHFASNGTLRWEVGVA